MAERATIPGRRVSTGEKIIFAAVRNDRPPGVLTRKMGAPVVSTGVLRATKEISFAQHLGGQFSALPMITLPPSTLAPHV